MRPYSQDLRERIVGITIIALLNTEARSTEPQYLQLHLQLLLTHRMNSWEIGRGTHGAIRLGLVMVGDFDMHYDFRSGGFYEWYAFQYGSRCFLCTHVYELFWQSEQGTYQVQGSMLTLRIF
jgi:hypothetical protein